MLFAPLAFETFRRHRRGRWCGRRLRRSWLLDTAAAGGRFAVAAGRRGGRCWGHCWRWNVCGFAHIFLCCLLASLNAVRHPFRKTHASPVCGAKRYATRCFAVGCGEGVHWRPRCDTSQLGISRRRSANSRFSFLHLLARGAILVGRLAINGKSPFSSAVVWIVAVWLSRGAPVFLSPAALPVCQPMTYAIGS